MILTSWKAIASHLDSSVRSAQRWESMGLPVKRPFAGRRSYVIAESATLDSWLLSRAKPRENASSSLTRQRARQLREQTRDSRIVLAEKMNSLRTRMTELQNSAERIQERWLKLN